MNLAPVVVLLALSADPQQAGGDPDWQKTQLRGVGAIRVIVPRPDARLAQLGVTGERLKTVAELRLRRAGIRLGADARTELWVEVSAVTLPSPPLCIVHLAVSVSEWTDFMLRGLPLKAELWESGGLLSDTAARCSTAVTDELEQTVDTFANNYWAANSKP